jgi:hypothetical protein
MRESLNTDMLEEHGDGALQRAYTTESNLVQENDQMLDDKNSLRLSDPLLQHQRNLASSISGEDRSSLGGLSAQ